MPAALVRNATSMPDSSIIAMCSSRSNSIQCMMKLGAPCSSYVMILRLPMSFGISASGVKWCWKSTIMDMSFFFVMPGTSPAMTRDSGMQSGIDREVLYGAGDRSVKRRMRNVADGRAQLVAVDPVRLFPQIGNLGQLPAERYERRERT